MHSDDQVFDFLDDLDVALTRHGANHHENASVIVQFNAGEWARFRKSIADLRASVQPAASEPQEVEEPLSPSDEAPPEEEEAEVEDPSHPPQLV